MNVYIKTFLSIFIIFLYSPTIYAECITGYACSIAELGKKEQEQLYNDLEIMKTYISRKSKPNNFIIYKSSIKNYNDIFLFKSIL